MNKEIYAVVIFHLNKELYKDIKARAFKKNIPIRAWLTRAIIEYIKKEDQYKKLL